MYLTRRQKEILDFIESHIDSAGYAPSIEEICSRFDLSSTATVHKHLSNLEQKGFIRRSSNRSRSIELCRVKEMSQVSAVSVPLLGRIAAGRPIEALEVPESIDLPESMVVGRRPVFVLKVEGDSMIDEQIRDGDYVIVEQRNTAEDGQIVVALIGGEEVTLKRFYREKNGVRLQPANVNMLPIVLRDGEFRIQGVVTGVLRKY